MVAHRFIIVAYDNIRREYRTQEHTSHIRGAYVTLTILNALGASKGHLIIVVGIKVAMRRSCTWSKSGDEIVVTTLPPSAEIVQSNKVAGTNFKF